MQDDYDDELDSADWSDGDWADEPNDVVACRQCGQEFYEDAPACPHCGEYVVGGSSVLEGKPTWYVALAIAGIVAVILILSGLLVIA